MAGPQEFPPDGGHGTPAASAPNDAGGGLPGTGYRTRRERRLAESGGGDPHEDQADGSPATRDLTPVDPPSAPAMPAVAAFPGPVAGAQPLPALAPRRRPNQLTEPFSRTPGQADLASATARFAPRPRDAGPFSGETPAALPDRANAAGDTAASPPWPTGNGQAPQSAAQPQAPLSWRPDPGERPGSTAAGGGRGGDGRGRDRGGAAGGGGSGAGGGSGKARGGRGGGSDPVIVGPPPSLQRRLLRDAREILGTVAIALGIAIVIKTFLVQPFFIPSTSMQATLEVGDRVLVSKLEPGPFELNRGDVVVFVDPGDWLPPSQTQPSWYQEALTFVGLLPANSGEHLIKRVIGLPGDTVKCCDAEGRLLVNNQPLDEPYIYPGDRPSTLAFEVQVPDGHLWVMGDHRSVSEDSRYHGVDGDLSKGAVPVENVVGRAVLVMWPHVTWLGDYPQVFEGVGGQVDGVR